MAEQPIHADHRKRMLKKFQENGLGAFSDHEVLEMLLYFAIPRIDTNEIAHGLKNHFGSLHAVLEASASELMQVKGIGERSAILIQFTFALFRRYQLDVARDQQQTLRLTSYDSIGEYFIPCFAGATTERLIAAYLDNKGRVLRCETLGEGAPGQVRLDTRRLLANALTCSAAGVALAHNHPRGDTVPSREDIALTDRVDAMLANIGLRLVDHVIVAEDKFSSINKLRNPFGRKGML